MKVGIITKIGKNYGAILQAFALKKAFEEFGAEAHIIKYTPDISVNSYKIIKFPWGKNGTIANIKSLLHRKEIIRGTKRFYAFREEEFSFIGNYRNDNEFKMNVPQCDIYVSGSDQVWNPTISFDEAFYFTVIDKDKAKLVSYAASIGLSEVPMKYYDEFRNRVSRFDCITVRERQAQVILSNMGIKSKVVPDPTLLLDRHVWNDIAVRVINEPYILCYFVSFPKEIKSTVEIIKNHYGIKVVNLMTSEESDSIGDVLIRDAGPKEFLGLFTNATFVVTSSFHGTVFSIINRKPFITTLYSSTSSRVTELLKSVGLLNRIFRLGVSKECDYFNQEIYSDDVEKKISDLKKKGREAIKNIISD